MLALAFSLAPGNALAQQSPLSGKQIRKITIEGLDKTPESEILGRLQFRIGERYNPEAVEREAAQLFALGKFKRVLGPYESKFEDGVAIRFVVEEKPIVYKVLYLGRDQLSESDFYSNTPALRCRKETCSTNTWSSRTGRPSERNTWMRAFSLSRSITKSKRVNAERSSPSPYPKAAGSGSNR
ncbi:MAG: POTRA domain-containing protein [Planctomycetota bacterium]|nr:POTRA domain-containing protein [Planctomycetota bacterium]